MEIVEENEHIEPPTYCLFILFLDTLSFCWVCYSTKIRRADFSLPCPLRCSACLARISFRVDDLGRLQGRANITDGLSALCFLVMGTYQLCNVNS